MDHLSIKLKQTLLQELRSLKDLGVDHLGYRYFLHNGNSYGLATCISWNEYKKDFKFYQVMNNFLSDELLRLKEQNYHFVSRSSDHCKSEYMKYLGYMNMDNSVGIYRFGADRIDSLFFIYQFSRGEKRDLIFNNFKMIECRAQRIISKIQAITTVEQEDLEYQFVIHEAIRDKLFNSDYLLDGMANCTRIIINGKPTFLTVKELKILKAMQYTVSNKQTAEYLGITTSTLNKHIHKIKTKCNVLSKTELLRSISSSQLSTLINTKLL